MEAYSKLAQEYISNIFCDARKKKKIPVFHNVFFLPTH